MKLFFILFLYLSLSTPFCWAGPRLGISALWHQSKLSSEVKETGGTFYGNEYAAYSAVGGGLLLLFPLSSDWDLEVDILYFDRGFINPGSSEVKTYWKNFFIPVVARLWATSTISILLGVYDAQGIGNVIQRGSSWESKDGFSDAGIRPNEYGLIYGGGIDIPLSIGSTLFFEFRLTDGLSSISTDSRVKATFKDLQILSGIRF